MGKIIHLLSSPLFIQTKTPFLDLLQALGLVLCYCQPALAVQGNVLRLGLQAALRPRCSQESSCSLSARSILGSTVAWLLPAPVGGTVCFGYTFSMCFWRTGVCQLSSVDPLLFLHSPMGYVGENPGWTHWMVLSGWFPLWLLSWLACCWPVQKGGNKLAFVTLCPQKTQENKVLRNPNKLPSICFFRKSLKTTI